VKETGALYNLKFYSNSNLTRIKRGMLELAVLQLKNTACWRYTSLVHCYHVQILLKATTVAAEYTRGVFKIQSKQINPKRTGKVMSVTRQSCI